MPRAARPRRKREARQPVLRERQLPVRSPSAACEALRALGYAPADLEALLAICEVAKDGVPSLERLPEKKERRRLADALAATRERAIRMLRGTTRASGLGAYVKAALRVEAELGRDESVGEAVMRRADDSEMGRWAVIVVHQAAVRVGRWLEPAELHLLAVAAGAPPPHKTANQDVYVTEAAAWRTRAARARQRAWQMLRESERAIIARLSELPTAPPVPRDAVAHWEDERRPPFPPAPASSPVVERERARLDADLGAIRTALSRRPKRSR